MVIIWGSKKKHFEGTTYKKKVPIGAYYILYNSRLIVVLFPERHGYFKVVNKEKNSIKYLV